MRLGFFFKLIRWKNIFMVFSIQWLLKFVLFPKFYLSTQNHNTNFYLLTIATLCIMAAGNIINDIFDVKADTINKPHKVYLHTIADKTIAYRLYYFLTTTGIVIGGLLSFNIGRPLLSSIFLIISLLLYFYSYRLKAIAFIGNIIISFSIGLSLYLVFLFDQNSTIELQYIAIVFAVFAFIINLIREIVKDIEDINGDFTVGLKTLPILIGRQRTKYIALLITVLLFISIIAIFVNFTLSVQFKVYVLTFIILPLLFFGKKLYQATSTKHYHRLSTYLKIIMLTGMLSILIL